MKKRLPKIFESVNVIQLNNFYIEFKKKYENYFLDVIGNKIRYIDIKRINIFKFVFA